MVEVDGCEIGLQRPDKASANIGGDFVIILVSLLNFILVFSFSSMTTPGI